MSQVAQQWLTLSLIVAIATFVVVSDVWLIRYRGVEASYSWVVANLLDSYPILLVVVVFAAGVVTGHCLLPVYAR